jgi:hypothetical protein
MSYIGSTPTTQSFIAGTDYFNGTGSAVSFTMSRSVNSVNDIEVIVNNVEQIPSGYSVSGTTLTFSAAPSAGTSNVYVRYLSTTNLSLAIPAGTSATFNTVTVADGSATTPSITNDGDTNTGIFFPAADTIAFAEGGVEAARFDSAGNLGIGATTINNAVTTYRGAGVNNYVQFTNATTGTASTDGCLIGVAADDTSLRLRVLEAASMIFTTSDTERARIDSSGNVLVGTTSASGKLTVLNSSTTGTVGYFISPASFTGSSLISLSSTASGTGWNHLICYSDVGGTTNLKILGNGNVQNANNSYGAISDIKLKENIVDASPKLDDLMQVKVRNYNMIGDTAKQIGVVAQELETVFPSMIDVTPDTDTEGNDLGTTTKAVKYSVFVPMLIKAIQEQQALITALTTRTSALEERLAALENNNATQ